MNTEPLYPIDKSRKEHSIDAVTGHDLLIALNSESSATKNKMKLIFYKELNTGFVRSIN